MTDDRGNDENNQGGVGGSWTRRHPHITTDRFKHELNSLNGYNCNISYKQFLLVQIPSSLKKDADFSEKSKIPFGQKQWFTLTVVHVNRD